MTTACAARAAIALTLLSLPCWAEAAPVGDPRLNGFWNVDAEERDARQGKIRAEVTPATRAIAQKNAEIQRDRLAHGDPVSLTSYTCGHLGLPFVINTSEPWLLVVDENEVIQVAERRQMTPRHIYMDGRSWPDLSKMPPSSNGYSIGHWEGKQLVIETRGLPPGGIQGGAQKGPKSVLTERVSLDAKGDRLTWSYHWEDPDYLAKPLDYAFEYDRAPRHTYAFTHFCDPNQDSARTVRPPPQD